MGKLRPNLPTFQQLSSPLLRVSNRSSTALFKYGKLFRNITDTPSYGVTSHMVFIRL